MRLHIGLDIVSFGPIGRSLGDDLAFGLARRKPLLLIQKNSLWAYRRILLRSLTGFSQKALLSTFHCGSCRPFGHMLMHANIDLGPHDNHCIII